jgi:Spy/CpxP family protein refolding chaperone
MSLNSRFLSIFALVAAFSVAALAQDTVKPVDPSAAPEKGYGARKHGGPEGFRGMRGGPGFELRGVNLTDAQKEQIHTIMENNKPDQASMNQMRTLMEAKRNGTLTAEQNDQLKAARQNAMGKHKAVHEQIMAVLTPEQLQQVEQNKQEMKKRMEERRQMREQRKATPPAAPDKPTDN